MDVFSFRENLIAEYENFSRSFVKIRANDISKEVDSVYASNRFWPHPIIQLNPNFESGGYLDDLIDDGTLDSECAKIFRFKRENDSCSERILLHRHQTEAIRIAKRGESYVLTTGTGSGKSLGYFIPIIDDVLRRKRGKDDCKGITAIVVYPMNALCNSQFDELKKYLRYGYGEGEEPVTFARYTGQESSEQRDQIAKTPPDILLTNYVMLELVMTRFGEVDKAIREHATGLRFLVLDELHTYRGRQGADVAMLVRRVRERFNDRLLCIGTSATIVSEKSLQSPNCAVADIASRLFGVSVDPSNVVSETLRRATNHDVSPSGSDLRIAIEKGVPSNPTHAELAEHPVAAWVELKLGLDPGEKNGRLRRISKPLTILEAANLLATDSELEANDCREYLSNFLLTAHRALDERGLGFFAFRLHQFISGAWNVYSTLEAPGERYLTLNGQQFKPGDRNRILYPLCFCRECGQEYFPVWAIFSGNQLSRFDPRDLSERSNDNDEIKFGYLMPDASREFDPADIERQYPGDWLELHDGEVRLKSNFHRYRPISVRIDASGNVSSDGLPAWFIPESFRFCLNPDCDAHYDGHRRSELTKLSGLSSEGRSSATTVLVLSSLKYLIGADLDERTKKVLAFTDNRQDASLQAGHFNDFVQILLLRGALLSAIRAEEGGCLTDDILTHKVLSHLCLNATDYAANPETRGVRAQNTLKVLRDVLGYRLYFDLKRGWRITNPNLEQLGLLKIEYRDLRSCCEDEKEWNERHPLLSSITPECRFRIVEALLEHMRKSLCVKTIYLDPAFQDQIRNRSFNELREPWGLSEDEHLDSRAYMVPRPRRGRHQSDFVHISHRSAFGRRLKSRKTWGRDNICYPNNFDESVYNRIIDDILQVLTINGYVEPTDLDSDRIGYLIDSSIIEWHLVAEADLDGCHQTSNKFFRALYQNVATLLDSDDRFLHQLEAREHTAQVNVDARKERENRFRKGLSGEHIDGDRMRSAGLPVLFCSPTMELGIDISMLNTVYMRNVPPTPANYVQRSGRAGRSGQPALVITYCAARAPHDQYFFSTPTRMVAGVVTPPNIDLANEDLIRSHLQAVWLSETGVKLSPSVHDVVDLDREKPDLPLRTDIIEQLDTSKPAIKAQKSTHNILATLESDLSKQAAPWYTDMWVEMTLNSASRRFNEAFNRWRSLFRAAMTQMKFANDIVNNAAASERERHEAKARYDEAYKQQKLLLDNQKINSDFYTYRYLAAEGFLPGYNFPRLPLLAFVPGRRERVARDSFLSRPRFLGLNEFGPRSIIYHEGSIYRVQRAILSIRDESSVTASARLPVQVAKLCPVCGYGHFGNQSKYERCVSCGNLLDGGRAIRNLYRIEQVSARRTNRITSDEEERQRQGYEMVTTLRFSEENGRSRFEDIAIEENGENLLRLQYGPAATLWRINLGWRWRKEKSVYGFSVDANTGEWARDSQAPTNVEDDMVREGKIVERITPFVEDTRNVLVLRPVAPLAKEAIVSLQYAIKRGIEQEYQLEDVELAAEPLPDQDNRIAILFYEAAEGGAGVLARLARDCVELARVARRALQVCHYRSRSGSWHNYDDLEDLDVDCEAGCYLCLLSYYNQTDHSSIDRRNKDMLDLLCRLARSSRRILEPRITTADSLEELQNFSSSTLEREWLDFIQSNGHRRPDKAQLYLEANRTRPDFVYTESQTLIYIDGPHHEAVDRKKMDENINNQLSDAGYTVVRFSTDRSAWPGIVARYAWVFGPGKQS